MKNDFKAIITLITAYTIGNFLMLLNRGMYWDAWEWMTLMEEKNRALLWSLTDQLRLYTYYFLLRFLGTTSDPIFFINLLSFMSWLLAGLLIYGILRKKLNLRIDRAFFISAVYILIPTLLVKVGESIIHYSTNNLLFFVAAFLYFFVEKNENRIIKYSGQAFSWLLFFLSFFTNSFLVFYGGFLLIIFTSYRQKNPNQPMLTLAWPWFKNNFLFIVLPIIFWILKISIWVPHGNLVGYNQFISLNANSLVQLIGHLWQNIAYGFFWPIIAPITILDRKIFAGIFLIIFGFFYLLMKKILLLNNDGTEFSAKNYSVFGLILLLLGAMPYLLVGKAPNIAGFGFGMRHALLLPLGSSLIILEAILTVIKNRWQVFIQTILLALFTTFTIYNYFWLDMDWYQQQAIIEGLKSTKSELIQNASEINFYDTVGIHWQNRNITSAEYFNYIQSALPENKVQLVSAEGNNPTENYQSVILPNIDNLNPVNALPKKEVINIKIISQATSEIFTVSNWLKIKKVEIFSDQPAFLKAVKDIYQIKILLL